MLAGVMIVSGFALVAPQLAFAQSGSMSAGDLNQQERQEQNPGAQQGTAS